jgi:hypothetical protein
LERAAQSLAAAGDQPTEEETGRFRGMTNDE